MAVLVKDSVPCLLHEDEHLLVVNKPAGLNTHAPAPHAGEGIYDWLRHREPRWANLAIIHRLDKETSGIVIFSKSQLANRSLTRQFTEHSIHKKYVFATDRPMPPRGATSVSSLVRAGERYFSRRLSQHGDRAETRFGARAKEKGRTIGEAEPITGRTHQIRVHAAEQGFPILGDTLYGGTPASRVFLHCEEIIIEHPATGAATRFFVPANFDSDPRLVLRIALIDPESTDAFRLIHGASDRWPGWYIDQWGDYLLSQSAEPLTEIQMVQLREWQSSLGLRGIYQKTLLRQLHRTTLKEGSPELILGEAAPEAFTIVENGLQFEIRFGEGYSVGLFLDQRENRRRFATGHVSAGFPLYTGNSPQCEVLNTFAYTCGFSVCAAMSGARVTSLDLSKKHLEWGRRNFHLNHLDPDAHDFIFGDVFEWARRLANKGRMFDVVALDPPTFSHSKTSGTFKVEKDYGKLVRSVLPLLKKPGILFASTNSAELAPSDFLEIIRDATHTSRRKIVREHYVPQPADFPISRPEPAHLKAVWLALE